MVPQSPAGAVVEQENVRVPADWEYKKGVEDIAIIQKLTTANIFLKIIIS